jgi:WD40 repeat protein
MKPSDPLIVLALSAVVHVFDVRKMQVIGSMRGHGEPITSLTTNPVWPNLVLSTSRDHTSRLWDLSERPTDQPHNPPWPGLPPPTLAGAPHGLQATEPEGQGEGAGACVALLMGGRAGGHEATVSSAVWHPSGLPIVATCGVRHVLTVLDVQKLTDDRLIEASRFGESQISRQMQDL